MAVANTLVKIVGKVGRMLGFREEKVRVSIATLLRGGTPVWMDRNTKVFAKEGYASNVIVFRCVDVIAKSMASIPLVVRQGNEIAGPEHPLVKLLARPNPRTTKSRMVHQLVAFRLITGNAYLEKLGPNNTSAPPKELWVWPSYDLRPIIGKGGGILPIGYGFDNGKTKIGWEVDPITGKSCILHWMTFNPLNPWFGMSPIESMARSVDQRNSADEWNQAMLQNDATPSGVMTSDTTFTEAELKQLRANIEEKYAGPSNAKRVMLLGGGAKWTQMALSPKDMDWLEGKNVASRDIAGAFGVPTQVIPIPDAQTFSNYEQARLALWEDTVIPLALDLAEELNHFFAGDFPGATISLDLDQIPALALRRTEKWNQAQNSRFISTDEKRAIVDIEKIDPSQGDGDAILVSAGDVTLEEVTGELTGEIIPREPKPVIDDGNTGHDDDPPDPEPEEDDPDAEE